MATNERKTARPVVLDMLQNGMTVILRHAATTRAQQSQPNQAAPVVLRTKLRVASKKTPTDAG
ncbi:hypothetical protein [Ralstonia pseudosolanacearum]|uniref:hypothetical protein n=1 Tax=Ralstonia pseudosolanacearum TaxID=1310165 RepID=UPI0026751E6B|nr:hypothetical protein [Ralstonia pseudosolanacearum]MDO3560908.1 hypothetical protein [Ralstonia pseudosolanacearum]MDO3572459.1 hypothetical protein [Ralstonia pseudosolanacearum]MDO3617386.1 hypothetical protein [Ralstonia pseudosolanacearum]